MEFLKSILVFLLVHCVIANDWSQYKEKYKLIFKSSNEETGSFKTFLANKKFIDQFNSNPKTSYKLKLNSRSHFSLIDFKDKVLLNSNVTKRISLKLAKFVQQTNPEFLKENLKVFHPREFNWVTSGMVTPVRDQQSCGCCYAFSACASVESAIAINTNRQVVLSPQQIVDCSNQKEYKNQGCDGGYAEDTFSFIKNTGIQEESSYPYQNKAGTCQNRISKGKSYKISSFSEIYMDVDTMIKSIINHGPLVAYIAASSFKFQYYGSGVFNDTSCPNDIDNLDHAITIVGYGTDSKTNLNYWLIKNSWGTDWGENGYMRIARGSNTCGIEINSFFPII